MRPQQLNLLSLLFAVPLLLVVGASSAFAEEPVNKPVDESVGKRLYFEGETYYAAGRYGQAAEKFEKAYALTGEPALLFNLGNAYERMGKYDLAIARLRQYLKSPKAKGARLISERIGRLEAAQEAKTRVPAKQAARAGATTATKDSGEEVQGGGSNVLSYVFFGIGAAALGTSLGLGLAANSAGDDAEALCSDGYCPASAKDSVDKQKGLALGADIALGVGIAAVATGTFLLVRNLVSDERPAREANRAAELWLQGGVGATGATVGLGGQF